MEVFTTILTTFITNYLPLFATLFGLGVSVLVTRAYSQALYVFAMMCVVLFFLFSNSLHIALAIASLLLATVVKNSGL